ncbi:MAG: hypothetical protein V1886_03770 [archaeon]
MGNKEISQRIETKHRFDSITDFLAANYEIDCLYIGDALMKDIGRCSLYLALDIRDNLEKHCLGMLPSELRGYDPTFARNIFNVDGMTLNNASINSVLLTPKQLETLARHNHLKLNIDHKKITYEMIALGYDQ